MKTVMTILFFALLMVTSCQEDQAQQLTGLSEAQVLQVVQEGTAEGKNYIITKNADGTFDVEEVATFPVEQ